MTTGASERCDVNDDWPDDTQGEPTLCGSVTGAVVEEDAAGDAVAGEALARPDNASLILAANGVQGL